MRAMRTNMHGIAHYARLFRKVAGITELISMSQFLFGPGGADEPPKNYSDKSRLDDPIGRLLDLRTALAEAGYVKEVELADKKFMEDRLYWFGGADGDGKVPLTQEEWEIRWARSLVARTCPSYKDAL